MTSRILYTLKGTKIFSKNRREAYNQLVRNMKNSMLYFDEVVFEDGLHQITYADTGNFEVTGPYKNKIEYLKTRQAYMKALNEKKPVKIYITPDGSEKSFPVLDSEGFSYFCSFQGELDILLENYTNKELDFIKIWPIDDRKLNPLVNEYEEFIRSQMSIGEYHSFLDPVMESWGFSKRASGISFKELLTAVTIAHYFDGSLILDPFHNDILNHSVNFFKEKTESDITQHVLSKVIPLMVSDYSNLSLDKIVDLRQEDSFIEFRNTISRISDDLDSIDDIDSYIDSLWTKELLNDIKSFTPSSASSFVINTIFDLAVSIPILPLPEIVGLQLLAGLAKMAHDKKQEYDSMREYQKSLSHFCSELTNL